MKDTRTWQERNYDMWCHTYEAEYAPDYSQAHKEALSGRERYRKWNSHKKKAKRGKKK